MTTAVEYQERLDANLCAFGCGNQAAEDTVLCASCRDVHNERQVTTYATNRALGICDRCRAPSAPYVYCAACRKQRAQWPSRKRHRPT